MRKPERHDIIGHAVADAFSLMTVRRRRLCRTRQWPARAFAVAATLALAACASHPETPPLPQPAGKTPQIEIDAETGVARVELSVMTYNVAGLPWPIKTGRGKALKQIAREIGALKAEGKAPDVIVLQEAFRPSAARVGAAYSNRLRGPRASDPPALPPRPYDAEFMRKRRILRGERSGKRLSSGLYVFSDYPMIEAHMTAFGRHSCAGYDCLANKGAVLAVIEVPGAPAPAQILNTHLNSNGRSGVHHDRALAAHRRQVDEIGALMAQALNGDWPLIYAGDFNTRNAEERFTYNAQTLPGEIVMQYCLAVEGRCDVAMSWDGDAPWLDTQDLQGFKSGSAMTVRPIRAEAMFDAPRNGRMLSDHDAYLVTYELSWTVGGAAAAVE
jgi:endonuclease/exonuclease/phosphatase family metal-dependent hydrolase